MPFGFSAENVQLFFKINQPRDQTCQIYNLTSIFVFSDLMHTSTSTFVKYLSSVFYLYYIHILFVCTIPLFKQSLAMWTRLALNSESFLILQNAGIRCTYPYTLDKALISCIHQFRILFRGISIMEVKMGLLLKLFHL